MSIRGTDSRRKKRKLPKKKKAPRAGKNKSIEFFFFFSFGPRKKLQHGTNNELTNSRRVKLPFNKKTRIYSPSCNRQAINSFLFAFTFFSPGDLPAVGSFALNRFARPVEIHSFGTPGFHLFHYSYVAAIKELRNGLEFSCHIFFL